MDIYSFLQKKSKLSTLDWLYVVSVFSVGFSKVLNNATPFLVIIYLSHVMNINDLGLFSVIVAILTFLTLVIESGLGEPLKKYLVDYKDTKIIFSPLFFYTLTFNVVAALGLFGADFFAHTFDGLGWLFGLTILFSFFKIIFVFYNAQLKTFQAALYQFSSTLGFWVLFFVFLNKSFNPIFSFLSARLISWLILDVFLVCQLVRNKQLIFKISISERVILFTINTLILACAEIVIGQFDVIFINYSLGESFSGIYKPVELLGAMPSAAGVLLSTTLLPILTWKIKEESYLKVKNFLKRVFIAFCLSSGIIFIFSVIFGKNIISFLYGDEFVNQRYGIFLGTLVAESLFVLSLPFINYFLARNRSSLVREVSVVKVILFFILSIPCLEMFNYWGMLMLLIAIYFFSLLFYIYEFYNEKRLINHLNIDRLDTNGVIPLKVNKRRDNKTGELIDNNVLFTTIRANHFFYLRLAPNGIGGNHYHKWATRWLLVLTSRARIVLEDVETHERNEFIIDSETPKIVIMEPYHAVKFTNIGKENLLLFVLTDKVYSPFSPDTFFYKIED